MIKNRMEKNNSSPCLRISFISKLIFMRSQNMYNTSSVSLEIPSFLYISRFCALMVHSERCSLSATSLSAVLSSVADADRNTGWFYDTEHKRLYVKTAGDNRQKIEIVVQ